MSETPAAPVSPAAGMLDDDVPEIDFDFVGSLADAPEGGATAAVPVVSAPSEPAPVRVATQEEAPLHAGFIVQHQGKLERVLAWRADTLVAGRSSECDIVLGQDEVSRRHARFERTGGGFEVSDLGSVNGTFVNGRRVERQVLQVGDIVQIEGFQLTFVLDREPLDGVVAAQPAAAPRPREALAMTMLQEEMPPRSGLSDAAPEPMTAAAADGSDCTILHEELAEVVALEDEVDDEKPEVPAAAPLRGSSRASSVQDLNRISQPDLREIVLELRLRVDLLPPALREAFEQVGANELVLPAELRLKA